MDFDEFARGFRERTAARLLEFEQVLEKAEKDLEREAKRLAAGHRAGSTSPMATHRVHNVGVQAGASAGTPADASAGAPGHSAQGRRPAGKIRSVLRGGDEHGAFT